MTSSPEPIFGLASEAIGLAMRCVATGETLMPFIMTEGTPGSIFSIASEPGVDFLSSAQEVVDGLDANTTAFAFAYDGYLTVEGSRNDAIFIEASYQGTSEIFVFAQRYSPGTKKQPAARVGNWIHLEQTQPRLRIAN